MAGVARRFSTKTIGFARVWNAPMILESQVWPPVIALVSGGLSGLGIIKSRSWVLGLAFGFAAVQLLGWMVLPLVWPGIEKDERWGTVLWASFLLALMVVVPYTTIGAIIGSAIVSLTRHWLRKRIQ
jgi:hypothetical protein